MESVANFTFRHHLHHLHHRHHQVPLSLHYSRPSISKPISSLSFPSPPSLKISSFSSPINASFSNSPSSIPNLQQKPSLSPLKTALITAVTATAVLLSQLSLKPVLAATAVSAPPPPATVDSQSVADQETEVKVESVPRASESVFADMKMDSDYVPDPETVSNLEQLIASNPKDVGALHKLLDIKLKEKKLEDALVLLDKLLILVPNDEEWPMLKGYVHIYTGDLEESKKTFHGIISKNPFRIEAYNGLIVVATQKKSEEDLIEAENKILEGLKKAIKGKNKSVEREFNILVAQSLFIQGEYEDALKIYKGLIKEEPTDFKPYLCQGIIYTLLKKDVEAEASFKMYRKLVPEGHPRKEYFENNMKAAKLLAQQEETKKSYSRS